MEVDEWISAILRIVIVHSKKDPSLHILRSPYSLSSLSLQWSTLVLLALCFPGIPLFSTKLFKELLQTDGFFPSNLHRCALAFDP
jgi:hypothetical protein